MRKIPAIVATLGSAFVWTGLGYVLQPAPGGSSPPWLSAIFGVAIPLVPLPVWSLALAALVAVLVTRSRLGIGAAGFGNNEAAMRQLRWPAARSHVITYLLSGVFGLAAGLCLTGVNTASDVNAASSYTLLSVAAVVMGGRGTAFGTLLGSIFLVMIVTTMQVLRVAGGAQDIVEGLLIILVLAVATVGAKPAKTAPAPTGQATKPQVG